MIPVLNLLGLASACCSPASHPAFLLGPAATSALLAGASLDAARRRSACGLWAGPAAGAMHLAWGAGFLWQAGASAIARRQLPAFSRST